MAVNKLLKTDSLGAPDDLLLKTDAAGAPDNNLKLTHTDVSAVPIFRRRIEMEA